MFLSDGLILSCGRTGTTYLTKVLEQRKDLCTVLQEPQPSRSIFMLTNAADSHWPTRKTALKLFSNSRSKWYKSLNTKKKLIEINPFIIGLAPELSTDNIKHGVVHIVRDPVTWIESTIRFGGYSWRSKITPYIPFSHERPNLPIENWKSLSLEEKFAWRWVYRNKQIAKISENKIPYLRVKYEDLFHDGEIDNDRFNKILKHIGLKNLSSENFAMPQKRINASKESAQKNNGLLSQDMKDKVFEICAPLLREYGYAHEK